MAKHIPEFTQSKLPFDETGPNPGGLCMCGCGRPTSIAKFTYAKWGWVKGKPIRYIRGHQRTIVHPDWEEPNPSGLCQCGCGQKTSLATQNNTAFGRTRGKPMRFLPGHNIATYRHSLEEAFWNYCAPGAPDACWMWQGTTNNGYGQFKWHGEKFLAHRVAYELHYGPIPVGDDPRDTSVCHTCDHPGCCNPAHLFLGTPADNARDMNEKGRHADFHGELNGCAKLTEADVMEIRRLCAQGAYGAAVARQFDISKGTVYDIIHRRSWKHIP